jgi:(p)ppGpp synthase/HD superfamily hydrolase
VTAHASHRSGRLLASTSEVYLPPPTLTGRFVDAVRYAVDAHGDQVRKGTEVPYVSHPLAVAALVLEHGGDEVQATAALLHDVVEDCGGLPRLDHVRSTFGEEVAGLVQALSDSITEAGERKQDWRPRKVAYLRHLAGLVADEHPAALVSLCDKLHNARAIVADATDPEGPGAGVWDRFTASAEETAWYYQQLAAIFADSRLPGRVVRAFTEEVRDLAAQAASASDTLGR